MKRKTAILIAAALALVVSTGVLAAAAGYDSSTNPIVTLNYLTNNFKKEILEAVDERINAKIAEITDKLEAAEPTVTAPEPEPQPEPEPVVITQPAPSTAYEVVQLDNGDALYAEGSCEVILRAGYAVCIAPDPTQGLADTTNGYEIYNGQALSKNHTCLIPRADGRGILATSDSVYIMVRGEYSIVKG